MRALLVVSLLVAVLPGPALAQSEEARAHFDAGREHARAERWAEALVAFQTSEALFPRPVTEFNIASALMRLGRVRAALLELERIEARSDLDDAFRRDVAALRAAARASIRTVVVSVSPAGARLLVDGEEVDAAGDADPVGGRREIEVDPGSHVLTATADGFAEERFPLGPGVFELDVQLDALPSVLVVESEPEATIAIDGVPRGLGHLEEPVTPGRHAVHVTLSGRIPFDAEAMVQPGERVVLTATLSLQPATPSLAEDPVFWAVVGSGAAAVVIGVVVGIAVATSSPQPYGGTSGVVIAPLVRF